MSCPLGRRQGENRKNDPSSRIQFFSSSSYPYQKAPEMGVYQEIFFGPPPYTWYSAKSNTLLGQGFHLFFVRRPKAYLIFVHANFFLRIAASSARDVMNDDRMAMNRPPPTTAPMVSLEGAQGEGVDVQTDGDVVQVKVLSESESRQKPREGSAGAADAE